MIAQSIPSVSSLAPPESTSQTGGTKCSDPFTSDGNPYLFPLHLLARNAGGTSDASLASSRSSTCLPCGDESQWWLIHTKPRQEKKLAESLVSRDVPHYLPVKKSKAVTRGRTRMTDTPLFTGYLFLKADPEQRRLALETNRIVASHPIADEEKITQQLSDLADLIEKGVPLLLEERLVSGQSVRVTAGLLKDKRGVVIRRVGKTRLFIFVNELLGGVSLEIEQHLLEPYG